MEDHRLTTRAVPGGLAFYIDENLQFDSRDEAVYHEALALPPLLLARRRLKRPLDALILGGGDGLALKRLLGSLCLRSAELVDYDNSVLALARKEFRELNGNALYDPRARVYARDAREHLKSSRGIFDIVLADFTFPEDLAGGSLFTRSFFADARARLSPKGLFAMNAVSPERFPAAFWSIYKTLIAARLYPRPLRVPVPSFRSHGYGDWGMFLASPLPLKDEELKSLRFARSNSWLTGETFRTALRLRAAGIERGLPLSRVIRKPGDMLALITLQEPDPAGGPALADFSDSAAVKELLRGLPGAEKLWWPQLAGEWEWRLKETLKRLDWELFLEELEKNAGSLSDKALAEIRALRENLPDFLEGALPSTDRAWQVFALLMTLLVLVNVAYPDNAYAKGSYYSGGSGGGGDLEITFFMQQTRSPLHNPVFQGDDVLYTLTSAGKLRSVSFVKYRAPGSAYAIGRLVEDRLFFALSDESFVSKNGDLFIAPGPQNFLMKAQPGGFLLLDKTQPEPVFEFYPEDNSLQNARAAIDLNSKAADKALADYSKWLAWASPAAAVSKEIRAEENETRNISDIREALEKARANLQTGAPGPRPEIPPDWFRLAPGLYLAGNGAITLLHSNGGIYSYPFKDVSSSAYTALPENESLEVFIDEMLKLRCAQTAPNDPRKAVFEKLINR
ncbi:MAG: fused MFS/spermidine synthase [Elusimicrobia bacterium]|nr:fused MFS/spermidine synthase [Elusimicrobiota bacterium]